MAEENGWIAVGDPRLVESDTKFPDVSPQTWCTGGYGIHRVVGKKTLEEVGAAGGEDADTATNVGVGVGGLRDARAAVDRIHVDVEVFVAGSEVDVDDLEVLLVVGIVLEGLLEGIEEGL